MSQQTLNLFVLLLLTTAGLASAQPQVAADSGEAAQIEAAIQSYIAAFNARDVTKLVGHWSPQGVYISRTSGEQIVGREALTEEFTSMFAGENVPTLAVVTDSIEFISPNVALERGTATVSYAADDVVETSYRVVYVKYGDQWLVDRVTEDIVAVEASNYEKLKELEWLMGEWVDQIDEDTRVEFSSQWTRNQNFIARRYSVMAGDDVTSSGLQIIGWDPNQKQIRSWLFDSSGSFVAGTWARRDDRWVVSSIATLADGAKGSFTSIFRPLEDGTFAWQKVNRVVDGQLLPQLEESIVRPQP